MDFVAIDWETANAFRGSACAVVLDATRSERLPCLELDFGCTLFLSRQHYDLPSNTLDAVAAVAVVRLDQHHEAVSDASAAADIMLAVGRDLGAASLAETFDAYRIELGRLGGPIPRSCRVRPVPPPFVEDLPTLW